MTDVEVRDYRYERKFLVEGLDAKQACLLIKRHPAMFYTPYPPRAINNFYLDTEDMENYYANVDGMDERRKVRIRWYGDLFGEIRKPMLEFKVKSGMVGTKQIYPFPPFYMDRRFELSNFQKLIRDADVPEHVRVYLKNLGVVLCNRYQRHYFATRDQHYRVTVDHEMAYTQVRRGRNHFRHTFRDDRNIILELKYDKPQDVGAGRVASFFPFSISKNSKYVTGIDMVFL